VARFAAYEFILIGSPVYGINILFENVSVAWSQNIAGPGKHFKKEIANGQSGLLGPG